MVEVVVFVNVVLLEGKTCFFFVSHMVSIDDVVLSIDGVMVARSCILPLRGFFLEYLECLLLSFFEMIKGIP